MSSSSDAMVVEGAAASDGAARPVSPWVAIPVILLCVGGGGWMLHWYVNAGDLSTETKLLQVAPEQVARANGEPPAIQQQDGNTWTVHGREAVAVFARPGAGKPWALRSLAYANYQFVPQEQRDRIFAARRLARDPALARSLKLTEDQIKQLRQLSSAIGMIRTPGQVDALAAAWEKYDSAGAGGAKRTAESALLVELATVATKDVDATRKAAAERAGKIKAVLSEEQWKQFEAGGK